MSGYWRSMALADYTSYIFSYATKHAAVRCDGCDDDKVKI